jgi:O-antigen ligase
MIYLAYAVIAALPLYVVRFPILGFPTTLLEILILALFLTWLVKNYKRLHTTYLFRWELIAWLAVSFIAVIVAGASLSSFGIWRAYFFEPALLFIVFSNLFDTKEKIYRAVSVLAGSAIVVSLIAAYQYVSGDLISNPFWAAAESRRATSLFPYPNAVGLFLAPLILIFVGLLPKAYQKNKQWFWFLTVAIAASFCAVLFAQSDGALFALVIAGLIGALIATKKTRLAALAFIIAACLAIAIKPQGVSYVTDRLLLKDFSGQIRRLQWRETINMLSDGRLISGAGLNNYQASIAPYHQDGFFYNREKLSEEDFVARVNSDKAYRDAHWQPLEIYLYPHNIVLNFWSELGFLGLLLFLWIALKYLWLVFINYFKKRDGFTLGLCLAMLVILIHGLVDVPYFKNDLAAMFWLFIAMLGVVKKQS